MKRIFAVFLAILFACGFQSATAAERTRSVENGRSLCAPGEAVVVTFRIQRSNKVASVCKGGMDYLVYRFGVRDKVELQFPSKPTWKSWELFKLESQIKGQAALSFENNGQKYEILQKWSDAGDTVDSILLVDRPNRMPLVLQAVASETIGRLDSLEDRFAAQQVAAYAADAMPATDTVREFKAGDKSNNCDAACASAEEEFSWRASD